MAFANDKKKYNKMEEVLQKLNKKFITINDDEAKKVNPVLKYVIEDIIKNLKEVSPLFKLMYTEPYYGGSYFDGLKVGKPEEFDIDLKMELPKLAVPKLEISNEPGFVRCNLSGWENFEKNTQEYTKYIELSKYKDDKNYLLQNQILSWMESIVTKALQKYIKHNNLYILNYPSGGQIEVSMRKGGPAMTLLINYRTLNITMDVDLVASFKFNENAWPQSPFRPIPPTCKKRDFLIVPKAKNTTNDVKDRLWRLSFQEQEREMMCGNEKFKPALRLIKKFRDIQNMGKISSYFLKTIFLTEVMNNPDREFWTSSLSYVLMKMLYAYYNCLEKKAIPYFWNKKNNLLKLIDEKTLENYKCRVKIILDNIERKFETTPNIIAEYILPVDERTTFGVYNNLASIWYPTVNLSDNQTVEPSKSEDSISVKSDTSDIKNNNNIIEILENLTKLINENNNIILKRLNNLENTINDIKNDNKFIKTELNVIKSYQIHKDISTINHDLENLNLKESIDCVDSTTNANPPVFISLNETNDSSDTEDDVHCVDGPPATAADFVDSLYFKTKNAFVDSIDLSTIKANVVESGVDVEDSDKNNLVNKIMQLEKVINGLKDDNVNFKSKLLEYVTN